LFCSASALVIRFVKTVLNPGEPEPYEMKPVEPKAEPIPEATPAPDEPKAE
jgi:hypothetical protein